MPPYFFREPAATSPRIPFPELPCLVAPRLYVGVVMNLNRLIAFWITLFGLLLGSSGALSAITAPPSSGMERVWFGTFTNTLPDGKISHDVTALILEPNGSRLSGSVGPSIDRLAPFAGGSISGNRITFHIDGGGGITFTLRLSKGHLAGTARGSRVNAALDLIPAPGLMPHAQLVAEILAADARTFAAYENCSTGQYAETLGADLEFYQDNQPVKTRQEILDSLKYRCSEGLHYRRELDKPSLTINSAPPYYAIEAGLHRIYSKQTDGSEHLDATVRFTMVWSKKSGTWRLARVVSYGHETFGEPSMPNWVTIAVTADVSRNADVTWDRIGGHNFCAIKQFIETQSCVLTSGNGEAGTVRLLNGTIQEFLVSRTAHSYTYAEPSATNFYHATMAVEAVDATHSRIVYTLLYDQGQMASLKAAAQERENRRLRFQNAVEKMKAAAEAIP